MKRFKIIVGAFVLFGLTAAIYIKMNTPSFCSESWLEIKESQVVQANVLPVIQSKRLAETLGTVSAGMYAVYGSYDTCWLPKEFDGYHAVFSTWFHDDYQLFQVSAFLVEKYQSKYQNLLHEKVEEANANDYHIVQEQSIFWRKDDVYYSITGQSELIKALAEAQIYE